MQTLRVDLAEAGENRAELERVTGGELGLRTSELASLQDGIAEKETALATAREELATNRQEANAELEGVKRELGQELETAKTEKTRLQRQVQTLQEAKAEAGENRAELERVTGGELGLRTSELASLQDDITEKETVLASAREELATNRLEANAELERVKEVLGHELETAETEKQQLETTLGNANTKNLELVRQLQELRDEIGKKQTALERSEKELESLKKRPAPDQRTRIVNNVRSPELQSPLKVLRENKEIKAALERAEKEKSRLITDLEAMKAESPVAQRQREELQLEIHNKKREREELKSQLEKKLSDTKWDQESVGEKQVLEKRIEDFYWEQDPLYAEIQDLQRTIEGLTGINYTIKLETLLKLEEEKNKRLSADKKTVFFTSNQTSGKLVEAKNRLAKQGEDLRTLFFAKRQCERELLFKNTSPLLNAIRAFLFSNKMSFETEVQGEVDEHIKNIGSNLTNFSTNSDVNKMNLLIKEAPPLLIAIKAFLFSNKIDFEPDVKSEIDEHIENITSLLTMFDSISKPFPYAAENAGLPQAEDDGFALEALKNRRETLEPELESESEGEKE